MYFPGIKCASLNNNIFQTMKYLASSSKQHPSACSVIKTQDINKVQPFFCDKIPYPRHIYVLFVLPSKNLTVIIYKQSNLKVHNFPSFP